jgi:translation initiation factor IF-3
MKTGAALRLPDPKRSKPFIRPKEIRVNERIRIPEIRLVDQNGKQLGVVPTHEARRIAEEANLDLVEVAPTARPPVCRIMDFGKYKYEQAKKAKESKKKQHTVDLKEMRYRPKIEEHDFQFKTRHVRQFLEEGNKVRCFVLFRGRERAHTEFGVRLLQRVAEVLADVAQVEVSPTLEGRSMNMVLAPR